jgi:hypothetical protein
VISALRAHTVTKLRGAAVAFAVLLVACGDYGSKQVTGAPAPTGIIVDLHTCPSLAVERTAVVFDEQGLRAAVPETPTLAVWLREPAWPSVPPCDGAPQEDRGARCASRDEALELRLAMSEKEFECTLMDGLGLVGSLDIDRALAGDLKQLYWEDPYHLSSGKPVPVVRAFRTPLTWPLVEQLARHPYVEQIDTVPGHAPILGTQPPPPPADCPTLREDPASKLTQVGALRGAERGGVAIELSLNGIVEQAPCDPGGALPDDCELCDAFVYAEWERSLQSTRRLVCLGRELDAVTSEAAIPLSYLGSAGSLCTPPILPGVAPMTTTAIGRALTWEEAERVAAHPYVQNMLPFGSGTDPNQVPGCPLDTTVPPPVPECSDEREAPDGKWTESSEATWSATPDAHDVTVQVRGAAKNCPAPSCPPPPNACPGSGDVQDYMAEWNWQSQRCVRELIDAVGGVATEERFWIVSIIGATLTWSQIQAVGAHPHVQSITPQVEPPL